MDDRFLLSFLEFIRCYFEPAAFLVASPEAARKALHRLGWVVSDGIDPTEQLARVPTIALASRVVEAVYALERSDSTTAIAQVPEIVALADQALSRPSYPDGASLYTLPPPFNASEFWRDFPESINNELLFTALADQLPYVTSALIALGVIEVTYVSSPEGNDRIPYIRTGFEWGRVELLTTPERIGSEIYRLGTPRFNSGDFAARIYLLLSVLGLRASIRQPESSTLLRYYDPLNPFLASARAVWCDIWGQDGSSERGFSLGMQLLPVPTPRDRFGIPSGVCLSLSLRGSLPTIQLGPVGLSVELPENSAVRLDLCLTPSGAEVALDTTAGSGTTEFGVRASVGSGRPVVLIGSAESSHLSVRKIEASTRVEISPTVRVRAECNVTGGEALIDFAQADGFIGSFIGGPLRISIDFAAEWSSDRGLRVRGAVGLGIDKSLHLQIGPLQVSRLVLSIKVGSSGLVAGCALDMGVELGPISVSIERVGAALAIAPSERDNNAGGLGSLDVNFGFLPPRGMGLAINAGPVQGGGFVSFDQDAGRYIGALAINISIVNLKAFAIVDTRAPGVDGYSFLVIISAEFTPLQLGFGFTLNGVGGIFGIQRSVSTSGLQQGVRDGSLTSLLFLRDPVSQASQLITGLQRIFPPATGQYAFGPMFKIGWGTPTIVTADIGIVLKLPSPIIIALIGQISAVFPGPDADTAVVVLHIDVAGFLDTGEKVLAIDASIRDSRIATFTLSGDMALRLRWGDQPDFAFSLGGFHKAFKPPPSFPELRRLTLSLCEGDNPRLTLAAYFALTANSLQFGARAELYAEALGFNVYGYLEFHALIIFSPFSFRFDFAAGFALRRGTSVIMGIEVSGMLAGPRPWHIQGSASISLIFFEVSVSFDETFGEPENTLPTEIVQLWPLLQEGVTDKRSWEAGLPAASERVVSLRSPEDDAETRLDPLGTLGFQQKALPLARRLTKFGEKGLAGPTTISLQSARVGSQQGTAIARQGHFAAGQFQHLTDAEKLSRPSFELMQAGATLASNAVVVSDVVPGQLRYRVVDIDGDGGSTEAPGLVSPSPNVFAVASGFSQVTLAPLSQSGERRFAPPVGACALVTLEDEQVIIVDAETLRPSPDDQPTASPGLAADTLRVRERARSNGGPRQRVVPTYEAR